MFVYSGLGRRARTPSFVAHFYPLIAVFTSARSSHLLFPRRRSISWPQLLHRMDDEASMDGAASAVFSPASTDPVDPDLMDHNLPMVSSETIAWLLSFVDLS